MTTYISQLDVSLDVAEERQLQSEGFNKIDVDLNKGTEGKPIYIWYKCGAEPITRVQFTFTDEMGVGLNLAGYTKIPKDLNTGAGGDVIYLWYFKGSGEFHTPIVEIDVTTDAESESKKFALGWEILTCDLNRRAKGNWIHAWVKREKQMYFFDVTATNSFGADVECLREGYIRLDEDASKGTGKDYGFFWYRQTTEPHRALKDLQISINDEEYQALQRQNYQSVSVNLNKGTGRNPLHLWYTKEGNKNPVKAITLLLNTAAVEEYEKAGVNVIKKNLNQGTKGCIEYMCVY